MTATRFDEKSSLESLSLRTTMEVLFAMQSALVIGAADLLFHDKQESFLTNPANTLFYTALRALEERSVVHIAEVLKDQNKMLRLPGEVRRKSDLFNHRDALSHPTVIKWRNAEMQRFYDERRHSSDFRPVLLWDMQRSINEQMCAFGLKPRVETIDVTPDMAIALSGILRLSLAECARSGAPSEQDIFRTLESFRGRYLAFLVERAESTASPSK